MISVLRLLPAFAGLATIEARHKIREARTYAIIGGVTALLAVTAYVCAIVALLHVLRPSLGPVGAPLAVAGASIVTAFAVVMLATMRRASMRRKAKRRNESLKRLAATGLSLVPLLARRNPLAALVAAGLVGMALAPGKNHDRD